MIPALTNEFAIHNSVPSLYATYVDTLQKKKSFKNTLFFHPNVIYRSEIMSVAI